MSTPSPSGLYCACLRESRQDKALEALCHGDDPRPAFAPDKDVQ